MRTIKELHEYAHHLRVLYVEDNAELREETKTLLKMLFKDVDTAGDGADGLKKYNDNLYDLVITDINMPNMDGIEMSRNIKEINPEQKISIVSAHDDSHILMNLLKTGANGFILKPMNMNDLISALYPICRDAYTQIMNIQLVYELNEKNSLLEKQNRELKLKSNAIDAKNQQLETLIQESKKTQKSETTADEDETQEQTPPLLDSELVDEYFKEDEDEGAENVLLLSDHCADLSEIFTEIPEVISHYASAPEVEDIHKISQNLSKASSILMYYSPYLDLLAASLSELAATIENSQDSFVEIMRTNPQSVLMLFDAVSADMERYIERFAVESLAMKNAHHIHEPTALSVQQIITLLVPPSEEDGEMEFF